MAGVPDHPTTHVEQEPHEQRQRCRCAQPDEPHPGPRLEAVTLWPLPVWKVQIPGSPRGWASAHVGGILNGVMICAIALIAARLAVTGRALAWVCYGMIATGWCNTVFYWAGNLAANRGLSVADTPHGKGDLWGAVAYLFGGGGMLFTLIAVAILARVAFARARLSH
jgi:hypothetical protein